MVCHRQGHQYLGDVFNMSGTVIIEALGAYAGGVSGPHRFIIKVGTGGK